MTASPPETMNWPEGAIFTLGHSTLPIGRFIDRLKLYGIAQLADIRSVPRSRYNPQYNFDDLAASLKSAGIGYAHLKALGGMRKARADSVNTGWREGGFRGYADYMETPEFAQALDRLIAMSRQSRAAIMCAESMPWRCHRSLVSDALVVRGVPVIEILTEREWRMRELTAFARVEGTQITYPPEQPSLF
jgi:uncharacterized protein (DUF488 family)